MQLSQFKIRQFQSRIPRIFKHIKDEGKGPMLLFIPFG